MKLVSVIIPAYNQAVYVGKANQSVLDQSYQDLECVVVDDGSKDHTYKIVNEFNDRRILYIRQLNQGLSAARNTGLTISSGEYISFLDSDDLFTLDKLTKLIDVMEKNPEIAMAAGSAYLINHNDEPIKRQFSSTLPEDSSKLLLGNPLHVGSVVIRREWQEKVGLFDTNLRSYEDWDFWIRLALAGGKMVSVNHTVSYYRFHTAQMTRNRSQMTHASFAVLDKTFLTNNLPSNWANLKEKAYSQAFLRAAANDFVSNEFNEARENLSKAFQKNPELLQNDGKLFLNQLVGWTELPKIQDPLSFLETIYQHFPPEIHSIVSKHKKKFLSQAAVNLGFKEFQNNNLKEANRYLKIGLAYNPKWIFNRGVLSILRKSILAPQR